MKTSIVFLACALMPAAASAGAPAVPPVPDPVEVGAAPVIDGANGTELCKILEGLPKSLARDTNIFSITADEYGRMSGAQAACIVQLLSTVDQIDHLRVEAWQRMEVKDVLWLLRRWKNGGADLKAAYHWLKARPDAAGEAVLAVLEAVPSGWYRDSLILGIVGPRYAHMEGRTAARLVSLISSIPEVSKVPREAWARMDHQDIEWLLAKWKSPNVQPKVVQYWMDAHRA